MNDKKQNDAHLDEPQPEDNHKAAALDELANFFNDQITEFVAAKDRANAKGIDHGDYCQQLFWFFATGIVDHTRARDAEEQASIDEEVVQLFEAVLRRAQLVASLNNEPKQ